MNLRLLGNLLAVLLYGISSVVLASTNSIDKIDSGLVKLYVLVKGDSIYTGTGFVVGKDGLVATNYHVIEGAIDLLAKRKLSNKDIKKYKVSVVTTNPALDVALLRVEGLEAEPLEISSSLPAKGDKVFAIGFPGVANTMVSKDSAAEGALESTLTEGVVGRVFKGSWRKGAPELSIIQHSAAINGGNSGGPLVDKCGAVVGINTGSLRSVGKLVSGGLVVSEQNQGIFYASSISEIIPELRSRNVSIPDANSSDDCIPFGNVSESVAFTSKSNFLYYGMIAVALTSVVLIGFAAYFFSRKPKLDSETYTHYVKRTGKLPVSSQDEYKVGLQLSITLPNGLKKSVTLQSNKSLVIGRDSTLCQIVVDDPSVSRKHAQLKLSNGLVMLRDLGSTNGTYVGESKVTNVYVNIEQRGTIRLGKVQIGINKS